MKAFGREDVIRLIGGIFIHFAAGASQRSAGVVARETDCADGPLPGSARIAVFGTAAAPLDGHDDRREDEERKHP